MGVQGKCTICNRPLTRPGRRIGLIGVVGPECYRKWAAIEKWAAQQGLLEALREGFWVPKDATEQDLRRANEAIFALRRSGFVVAVEHHHDGAHVAVVGITSPKRLKEAVR